ncbi:hypothetical protein DFH28DRAFT_962985 [Melampsora americana]|nr:hypothetical protein DFH28DRAFT_962985 [Melampsora americana]
MMRLKSLTASCCFLYKAGALDQTHILNSTLSIPNSMGLIHPIVHVTVSWIDTNLLAECCMFRCQMRRADNFNLIAGVS